MKKVEPETNGQVTIAAPRFQIAELRIRGTAPYVQHAFGQKAKDQMHATQIAGSTAKKGTKREPKDFQAAYQNAMHVSTEGWAGIPAAGFRAAMVSACKVAGFQMTRAKLGVFVLPDGFSKGGDALVRITKGEPEYTEMPARNDNGSIDLRARPMWQPGWEAIVRIRFDQDMFTLTDCANLLMRVGMQVGIGEGRPDSKKSCGMGWGLFELVNE